MVRLRRSYDPNKEYEQAPAGNWPGVCCDVAELGWQETRFGWKNRIRVVWLISPKRDDGKPFMVDKYYNNSDHLESNIVKDLGSWRGRAYSQEEIDSGIELDDWIGKPALLNVVHATVKEKTYANVSSVTPLPEAMEGGVPEIPSDYVRWNDREGNEPAPHPDEAKQAEDDVPI